MMSGVKEVAPPTLHGGVLASLALPLTEAGIRPYFLPTLREDGGYFIFVEEASYPKAKEEAERHHAEWAEKQQREDQGHH
jgi:hypothetical protein